MDIANIPIDDLKFIQTTDKKICPKCHSASVFDTGHRANNIKRPVDVSMKVPEHPVYRCEKCGQLFRLSQTREN